MMFVRRHGWQLPFHPLQIVGMAIYVFLVVTFYTFLGLFLGNRVAEITLTTLYSVAAALVMLLFFRCTAIDPTDTSRFKKKTMNKSKGLRSFNYWFILKQIVARSCRRSEKKILKTLIRRKYLDPVHSSIQLEPLIPFPLVVKDDAVFPDLRDVDISFCTLCDFEVKMHSKHCRTCNRCVEGFDHHCRWLNNCVGKKNYTTFFLLMVFILIMLLVEGGSALTVFVRCFADKNGIDRELKRNLHMGFPREALTTIAIFMVLLTAYSSAAMGQLFFFHVVLIRKGMRTYDYIMAMKEANQSQEFDPFDDYDSDFLSDSDFDTPEKSTSLSNLVCGQRNGFQSSTRLSIKIESDPEPSSPLQKKERFRVGITPWKLLNLKTEDALLSAERARARMMKEKSSVQQDKFRPPPLETKLETPINQGKSVKILGSETTPGRISSPRRRFSGTALVTGIMASPNRYRSSFDMKLRELDTLISRQVLPSETIKKDCCENVAL